MTSKRSDLEVMVNPDLEGEHSIGLESMIRAATLGEDGCGL